MYHHLTKTGKCFILCILDPKWQKKGFGNMLVSYALEIAEQNHASHVYLLTTTAESYFEHLEFEVVDRNKVPLIIQQTSQYTDVCPSTAVVMCKKLDGA